MRMFGGKRRLKSNSALAIAAGCAVAFMFIATIISIGIYQQRINEAKQLLVKAEYDQYDSYVVMISSNDSSAFWRQVYESAKERGAENGVYVDMLSDSIDKSYTKQEYIEMAIESNCDGILLEGDDSEETANMVAKAKREGIPVFTLENDMNMEDRISYIGANSYTIATLYGQILSENLVKQKKVMILGGNTVNSSEANAFVNNMQAALDGVDLANSPLEFDVRTIESQDAFANEEYIQNLFKVNDLAPVVICLDQDSTEIFYQAMIDYNKVGQILLFGSNSSQSILTGIKQGVIASTVYVNAESIGVSAADAYIEYRDAGYVSDYISVEAKIIDSSNVAEEIGEAEDE